MPEEQKTVDIDTSGPDTEVELTEDQSTESTATEQVEDTSTEAVATPPLDASDSQQEASDEKDDKKEELEEYSQGVQRRIAKLTKKWREAERQRDEALSFAKLQKQKAEELNKKYSTLETSSVKDRQAKLKSLLEAQKAKLAQAVEAQDGNTAADAQSEIAKLSYEEARLEEIASAAENQPKEAKEQPVIDQKQPDIQTDPKAEAWASKNRWFGTDKAMTYTAFDLHKQLVDEEGYDPKSDEYYTEIDKRLRVEFPHKFDNTNGTKQGETTKPVQTVASATRSTKTGRKTVRLTPSQVAIAKKLGVPLEEYAKQLKLTKEV